MRRLEPGMEIDGFRLTGKLASGGMASLWRAEHPGHAFPLVLKIPFLDPGEDVSVIVGYEVEEMILKRLEGPHVPRFVRSGSRQWDKPAAINSARGVRAARSVQP